MGIRRPPHPRRLDLRRGCGSHRHRPFPPPHPMKIISLHAENVKRLKAVDITPDSPTVVIAGKNGQGKSSVLDSILLALAGKDAAKLMTRPIRDGAERA